MESKHTPGPWTTNPAQYAVGRERTWEEDQANSLICTPPTCPFAEGDRRSAMEHNANMRLIAAAPDLLAACKQVLDASEDNGDMEDIDWNGLRSAIARAEGGGE